MTAPMRHLPSGWTQVADLVGRPAVSEAEAAANLKRRTGPTVAMPAAEGLLPGTWCASRLLRAVNAGEFPEPVSIPGLNRAIGWHRSTVLQWIAANPSQE